MSSAAPIVHALGWLLLGLAALGLTYLSLAALASLIVLRRPRHTLEATPPITLLKPLHGAPAGLRQTLEGFCAQDYAGPVQIVFGVHDASDPAIAIIRALQRAHPDLDIELVIDPTIHGANRKATNLINMAAKAKHPVLILSDADIVVDRGYVGAVTAALAQPDVGLVSCF